MLTSKQRASLRAQANTLDPLFQVGKGGLTENFFEAVSTALEARELIKLKILDSAFMSAKETAAEIAQRTACEVVQVIGAKMVFYKKSEKNPKIVL